MRFPKTLLEFQARFPDEASCGQALWRVRWPDGFRCPRCAHRNSYPIVGRRLEQCRDAHGVAVCDGDRLDQWHGAVGGL